MEQFYHITLAQKGAGLFNQIFTVVTAVILAYRKKNKVVVVEAFSKDFDKLETSPLSDIIDLKLLNDYIYNEYGIIIVDADYLVNILKCIYIFENGDQEDVTKALKDRTLRMDLKSFRGEYKGKLIIDYSVNDYIFQGEFQDIINFPPSEKSPEYPFAWIHSYDKSMFEKILDKIEFNNQFKVKAYDFIFKQPIGNQKINTLHFKIEEDAIKHLAIHYKQDEAYVRDKVYNKHIEIIKKYIPKEDLNIILSHSKSNPVITYMQDNGYNFKFCDKDPANGREINAIHDYLIGTFANNIFLGSFKSDFSLGSSFSICIYRKLRPGVKCILWDANILSTDEEEVIIK